MDDFREFLRKRVNEKAKETQGKRIFHTLTSKINKNDFTGFLSLDKTKYTDSAGNTYDVVISGEPDFIEGAIGINSTTVYVPHEFRPAIFYDGASPTAWFIIGAFNNGGQVPAPVPAAVLPEFNLVKGDTLDQYRIPKEAFTNLYDTPPLTYGDDLGFLNPTSGSWKVSVSPDLKYIVLVRVVYHAYTDILITTATADNILERTFPQVYWAVIQDFQLGTAELDLTGATITEGNFTYTFGGTQVTRYTPSPHTTITTTETQLANPVISYTGTDGAPIIDLVLECTSEARQVFLTREFVASSGAALDIAGSNMITSFVDDYETYGFNPGLTNQGKLYFINGVDGIPFAATRTSSGQGARAVKWTHSFNASPTLLTNTYMNPYDVPSLDDNSIFVMDGIREYHDHNAETEWTNSSIIKCVTDEKFTELVKTSLGGGAFHYKVKVWQYDSGSSTFSNPTTIDIKDLSAGFSTYTESGLYPYYYIMDWIIK